MNQVTGLTSEPNQSMTISMPDGSKLFLALQYFDQNMGWYFHASAPNTGINWNGITPAFQENGRRIVTHPNMLRNYRLQINFGIACFTIGNREPTNIQDFITVAPATAPASSLYILTASEVQAVELFLENGKAYANNYANFQTYLQGLGR